MSEERVAKLIDEALARRDERNGPQEQHVEDPAVDTAVPSDVDENGTISQEATVALRTRA